VDISHGHWNSLADRTPASTTPTARLLSTLGTLAILAVANNALNLLFPLTLKAHPTTRETQAFAAQDHEIFPDTPKFAQKIPIYI
jgi:hypothetical protein